MKKEDLEQKTIRSKRIYEGTVFQIRKDEAEMLEGPRTHTMLIEKGMFWIAFPHDAHRPAAHTTEGHSYRKIIMKLPVA